MSIRARSPRLGFGAPTARTNAKSSQKASATGRASFSNDPSHQQLTHAPPHPPPTAYCPPPNSSHFSTGFHIDAVRRHPGRQRSCDAQGSAGFNSQIIGGDSSGPGPYSGCPSKAAPPAQVYPVDSAQPRRSMGFPPDSARATTATAVWLPAAWRVSLHSRLAHSGQTHVFACTGFRSE